MVEEGGSAKGWFAEFCRDRRITRKDKVYHDMANLVEAVEVGATIDQVNLGGLVMLECLMRRLMSLAEAYDRGPEYPNWQLASFISAEYRRGDLMPADFRSELGRKAKEHLELKCLRKRLADRVPRPAATNEVDELVDVGALPTYPPANCKPKAKAKSKAQGGEKAGGAA